MGVRSSCAASAVKRRSAATMAPMRSSNWFSAATRGSISAGASSTCTGTSAWGGRSARVRLRLRSGAVPWRTAPQMASASNGSATAMGQAVLRSTAQRMSARDDTCSPT